MLAYCGHMVVWLYGRNVLRLFGKLFTRNGIAVRLLSFFFSVYLRQLSLIVCNSFCRARVGDSIVLLLSASAVVDAVGEIPIVSQGVGGFMIRGDQVKRYMRLQQLDFCMRSLINLTHVVISPKSLARVCAHAVV